VGLSCSYKTSTHIPDDIQILGIAWCVGAITPVHKHRARRVDVQHLANRLQSLLGVLSQRQHPHSSIQQMQHTQSMENKTGKLSTLKLQKDGLKTTRSWTTDNDYKLIDFVTSEE
jgi:hypothetical protein